MNDLTPMVRSDSADERAIVTYDPETLRQFMREEAWAIGVTADQLHGFLDLHDSAGRAYVVRLLVARVRALADADAILASLEGGRDG
jgi:hypothetical protein